MRKTDYQKGITKGLALRKTNKRLATAPYSNQNEISWLVRDAERSYMEKIGNLPCPFTGEVTMRGSFFRDGVWHAFMEGTAEPQKFVVVRFSGQGCYNVNSLAEQALYDDPAFAWKRSWELDPAGHKFKSIELAYVTGGHQHFGLPL